MRIVLASASPRRRALLSRVVPDFDVLPSGACERFPGAPDAQALGAARAKADAVADNSERVVIAADTIVVAAGRVLGKPANRAEAREMLLQLSAREHEVITALSVLVTPDRRRYEAVERTAVHFVALCARDIEWYLDRGEYVDKAGGYGIQGYAARFVDWIRGDYTTVMGLPVARLVALLREAGVDVWGYHQ